MKITCTKKEFANLIRTCNGTAEGGSCYGCALTNLCGDRVVEESEHIRIEITEDEG